jgi:hypothetical protein
MEFYHPYHEFSWAKRKLQAIEIIIRGFFVLLRRGAVLMEKKNV